MATLDELWLKIANNTKLMPQEIDELRRFGRETQMRNSFVAGNTTAGNQLNIKFPFLPIFSEVLNANINSKEVVIPSGFLNLVIITYGRITGTGVYNMGLNAYVNGDTGNNYNHQSISANGTATGAQQVLNNTQFRVGFLAGGGTSAARTCASFSIIPNYRSTAYKHCILMSSATNVSDDTIVMSDSIWNNTAPIDKLTFYAANGDDLAAGSSISIYGIL